MCLVRDDAGEKNLSVRYSHPLRREAGPTQPRVSELLAAEGVDIKPAGIRVEKDMTMPNALSSSSASSTESRTSWPLTGRRRNGRPQR